MNIFLLRHGQKKDDNKNRESLELTELGFRQADLLGKRMKRYSIERIYSSAMKRAVQTAEGMNRHIGTEIVVRPELREIHMGACENNGWGYLEEQYPDFLREHKKHEKDLPYPPDGECGQDVWLRAKKVMDEIVDSGLENVAVVAHGGTIRALICGVLNIPQTTRFYFGAPPENCSISLIKYNRDEGKYYLHRFNDTAHLEE